MWRRKIFFWVLGLGLLLPAPLIRAQSSQPTEPQLKAAFLYNFAKFTDWPSNAFTTAESPFVIGIFGDNPFGKDLEQAVVGKKISEHPMTIRMFRTTTDITNCHLLFINPAEKASFPKVIEALRGSAVLTVSETDDFITAGGMINFVKQANKIRFQINDETAKEARLKISSRLLGLAISTSRG